MHHKIKAALYKNQFAKSEAQNYIARVKPDLTLSPEEICRIAIERGGHPATAEALAYHADAFLRELTYQLLDNVAVHTDDFQFSLSIRGTFDSNQDNFDPERHALIVEIQPTKRMQKKLAALEIELANSKDSYATIDTVTDTKTGVENNRITSGGTVVVTGTNIRIAGQHPDNGLHFTNIQTGEITTVNEPLAKNTRKSIIFTAPKLENGAYNLYLITQDVGGGNRSKTPRKTVFRNTLTVMT